MLAPIGAVSAMSQWNPCRSRGASLVTRMIWNSRTSLSGTPAEAGVRDDKAQQNDQQRAVSVEPLPKQGCEGYKDKLEFEDY